MSYIDVDKDDITEFPSWFFRTNLRYDEIPQEMRVESEERRLELIEHLSNVDDTIGEMFLGVYV